MMESPKPNRAVLPLVPAGLLLAAALTAGTLTVDAGRGPIDVVVPSSYQAGTPTPLVLLLHGYTSSGAAVEATLGFTAFAEERGFFYAYPDGTVDGLGLRFWSATDACCDFNNSNPDDVGYLEGLLDAIADQVTVDPERTFLIGHSNGGFMAYRFACDRAERVAAIVSYAGATFDDPTDCSPSLPVRTLQVHGDNDGVIAYGGGSYLAPYPGAIETTETWATYNGCSTSFESLPSRDLVASLAGNETSVRRYRDGCTDPRFYSEIWTLEAGGHSLPEDDAMAEAILDFLFGRIFSNGFESGNTSAWSNSVP